LLPPDIVIHRLLPVSKDAHCRFDALSRSYCYNIYRFKDPFRQEYAYYYPYDLNRELMQEAASYIIGEHDFTSFSKRNTQVRTFSCRIMQSEWVFEEWGCSYRVRANRFLRGMVRGLTGTMLKLGRSGGG